ncbi:tRNA glutamyl-Q(34) synthetase GluQRS [Thiomicrospira sp.]|uniref:tRNA glutamyl-Q(34) synthetase GluQRS n=1 Tax=Thiomicrospira sp. TaxID=935 RepID=UPI002F94DAD4
MTYVGRFAPTPSGPLHFGSLIAATASFLDAKANQGQWLLRIDDLDTPRVVPDSIPQILHQLDAFGFEWDQTVLYQSQSHARHIEALEQLIHQQQAFYCDCTRKQIFARDSDGLYSGYCRDRGLAASDQYAVRFKSPDQNRQLTDLIQGQLHLNPLKSLGDFVLKRRDGYIGYHLACATDDLAQGVTHVIRGSDLLQSSFAQTLICQALANQSLQYGHHPVAVTSQHIKYSKSAQSPAIDADQAVLQIWQVLAFLNQSPPLELQQASLNEIWSWAIRHWHLHNIPAKDMIEI